MNGVTKPGTSAGSNHVGASVTWSAMVTRPSGAAWAGAESHTTRASTTARASNGGRAFTSPPCSASLELDVFVWRDESDTGDGGHVQQSWSHPRQPGLLDDRPEH